jgi:hypothetical protein
MNNCTFNNANDLFVVRNKPLHLYFFHTSKVFIIAERIFIEKPDSEVRTRLGPVVFTFLFTITTTWYDKVQCGHPRLGLMPVLAL